MANTFLALPTNAANGPGTAVDVSTMGATKTIVMEGNGSGLFEPYVQIEISNDSAGDQWTPIYQFKNPGSYNVDVACHRMRATVQNYNRGGAPTVNIGGEDTGTTLVNLPTTATNGTGTPVDVSGLGPFKTVQVTGTFKGACIVQVSNDGGTSWSQADGFAFRNKGSLVSGVLVGQRFRVVRSGIQAREPFPGLPIINIGAADPSGGGGSSGVSLQDAGVPVSGGPFTTLNFTGPITVTDGGAGVGNIANDAVTPLAASIVADNIIVNAEKVIVGLSIPANRLAVGSTFRISAFATTTGAAGTQATYNVRIGPVTLTGNIAAALPGTSSTAAPPFELDILVTVRTIGAGGTVIAAITQLPGTQIGDDVAVPTATVAINTTVANLLELTGNTGNAAKSNTFYVAMIQQVR